MSQLTQDKPVLEPITQGFVEVTTNPLRRTTRMQRILKHPHLMHYNRLIALVMAANLVALTYGLTHGEWWSSQGSALKAIVIVAQANFALAIIIRQPYVINLLHWLATRAPRILAITASLDPGEGVSFRRITRRCGYIGDTVVPGPGWFTDL